MAKDINLTSQEWCDIVFEGKNKAYGAYTIRQSSSKRHLIAILIVFVFTAFLTVLPTLIETIENARRSTASSLDESSVLAELKELEDRVKEQDIIRQETAPPPPPLKSTVQFTAPVMVDESELDDDTRMKSQDELAETKIQISIATVEGEDVEGAIDIAELDKQKVIVEDKEEIYYGVEIQPSFPGGEDEMMKYIHDNLVYPVIAAENGVEGRVTIRFVVNKKGEVTEVTVLRGLDPSCDKEAVRVVKSMPKWVPGKQNGVSVNVYYTLPIVYKLQR
ncbi:MAG: energy transducer TonB [Prevotellaceae bacterium]|jgi:protein TonB|nr:energy transducer TonB [Prevotellaceae bacterium]